MFDGWGSSRNYASQLDDPDCAFNQQVIASLVGMNKSSVSRHVDAAAQAALLAKFSPATSGGKPISSYAWLDFDFPRPDLKKDSVVADPDGTVEKYSISPGASENVNSAVGGPMVKGTARRIPKPPYPKEGRAVRAEGSVSILVMIDERGNVFSANALSGHHLLRPAAVEAACEATFSPTTFNGVPIRVSATISYNFVP